MPPRALVAAFLLWLPLPSPGNAGEFVWIEGEAGETSFRANIAGWGRPQLLSGEKWLHVNVEEGNVEKDVPADGIRIGYAFPTSAAGRWEVWNRIGFEFARSPFDWRVDGGAWARIAPEELTTDLMELDFWCEVAWLKLGEVDLAAGDHRLEVRLPVVRDDKEKAKRILYASDAVCLHRGPFRPNSRFRPGESGRDARDEEASRVVFRLPEAAPAERAAVRLGGTWEVARDDEQLPGEVAAPIAAPPSNPVWRAIPVPSDKNQARDDLVFAHRIWYRTRVEVPASLAGRAFFIDFPLNNLNTTVFVNGLCCGFEKNPFAPFRIDVTRGVRAGGANELLVGIRDAWYGRAADPARPLKLRRTFNYPLRLFGQGFQDLDYPVWNCPQSGILATPTFVAAGGCVYASDVFVKPSVSGKRLEAEIALANAAPIEVSGELRREAVDDATGRVERTFAPVSFRIPAGGTVTVAASDAWTDPTLWWPDAPTLYRLRVTVVADGRPVDSSETLFGFREWRCEGTKFTLNGVVWHLWADLVGVESSPEAWLAAYRRTGQRLVRISTAGQATQTSRWLGMEPRDALEFCDRNGVVVRRNTTLDGEAIGYHFSEPDEETRRKQGGSEMKEALMRNWRDQCVAQVKGERNHPSIQIWSLENEFAFINLINLLGNSPLMDRYEDEIAKTHDAVRAADPTRPAMIDGGGATRKDALSVHGDHYVATLDSRYPDLAYEPFEEGGGRGRWTWDRKRPRYLGEDFYANGINPADYARWGGEVAFQGKAATRDAIATVYRMLQEGYRWGGHYAAWHLWLGGDGGPRQWGANAPRAALVRDWDWTFGSGEEVPRTLGVFNDSRFPDELELTRTLTVGGRETWSRSSTHRVPPGSVEKLEETMPVPEVAERTEARLLLVLRANGEEVHRDEKAVSILPPESWRQGGDADPPVAVLDPSGETAAFLRSMRVPLRPVRSLAELPEDLKVLVVGRDALGAADSTSTALAAWASRGRAAVVLDQSHPLKYQALPADLEPAPRTARTDFGAEVPAADGRTAFLEDASHPALEGLADKDFFTWGPDRLVYRNAWRKPARGAKSLVQCGPRLGHSALVEVPAGKGVLYLVQLDLTRRLADGAVAKRLLVNLLRCAAGYRQEFANVSAAISDPRLAAALDAIGLRYGKAADPVAAISDAAAGIAIVSATPSSLRALAAARDRLEAFWRRGGTVVLHGLTPEGLEDYGRIVGVDHVIRPFRRERVTFPAVRHPLTAGLTTGDIVMLSGERIFGWTADEYVASDVFTHVVDLDDAAPFATSAFFAWENIVNGFVGSDGWPLIIDFEHPEDGKPYEIPIELAKEETIVEYTHDPSVNYNPTTRIALVFDGRDRVEYALEPNGDAQTFEVSPPRKARRVTLQLLEWTSDPAKRPIIGIDNIAMKVARGSGWKATVRPMLNVGGLVHYAKGKGGVVLCNLRFQEAEKVPVNATKKRAILSTVLRNLKAPFAGGKTVIAGGDLDYQPIDLHTKATTYKDERGWFGDARRTLKALPAGEHVFAGVRYSVYEMPTSPVPQVLVLSGRGLPGSLPSRIEGIPVDATADALFFLHAARLDEPRSERERAEGKRVEIARYLVRYADGETAEVPILAEVDVDHWLQDEPRPIPGAQVAWTGRFEGSEESAVLYSRQWNNPRPEVRIAAVDMVRGADGDRGVPALIAITAARAR